jgi:hypothetical protein
MKLSGTFSLVKTNIETGEQTFIEQGNIITNRYYRDILKDGSGSSIGFYIWTSPYTMTKSRRRVTTEASPEFLNDAYGYIPQNDWFARYIMAENNMPGYFETRSRIDPPTAGIRILRSIIMSSTQPRTDNITGLLPEYSTNTMIDSRNIVSTSTMSKLPIFAYVTLEDDCIQTELEVFDIYYRLVFDNNYADVNLSKTAIELLGKQSTARMPCLNYNGSYIMTTPVTMPALSREGPVNFSMGCLPNTIIGISNGDSWYDYGNIFPTTKISNGYVTTYYANLGKDTHVGKLVGTLYCTGGDSQSFLSGYKSVHIDGERTIGNTHSHNNIFNTPFFDPSRMATGVGYCDITSTTIPEFPEYIEVRITDSGTIDGAKYKIAKYPFTGFYKNTFNTLPIEMPHISQLIVFNGTWRNGLYYNGTDDMHGILTGKAGVHPSMSGISYDSDFNYNPTVGRAGISGYNGAREYNEYEIIGYDNEGISILSLSGSIRTINRHKSSQFLATNIVQIEVETDSGDIYAVCADTGLYRLNSNLTSTIKVVPTGVGSTEACYGFALYQDKIIAFFDSGIYYSIDGGLTFSTYQHPDYPNHGLDKNKICGIRADLSLITPNVLILFSNIDGSYTTSKKDILAAWWSTSVFNIINTSPASMFSDGVSPSFLGIDYVKFINGTFYLTFTGANISSDSGTYISSVLFNTSTLNHIISYSNSSTNSIPLFFNRNNKDYILCAYESSVTLHNITDGVSEITVSSYGQSVSNVTSLNMSNFSPFYIIPLSSGLTVYRGTSVFHRNIYNDDINNNIRNDTYRETVEITATKITNTFFESGKRSFFEKLYGWDGNQFSTISNQAKTINSGANIFDGITFTFTGSNTPSDFVSGDSFSAIRLKGFVKDNTSLAKIFFSNSNFIKSQKYTQSGQIVGDQSFYKLDKFELEEGDIEYTTSHFEINSRSTPFDHFSTRRIPQQVGSMRFTIDTFMKGGFSTVFNIGDPGSYQAASFGLIVYRLGANIKARITSSAPSYRRDEMIVPNNSYPEISLVANDIIEISWTTSSTRRLFTLKVNGTILNSGLNFDGQSDSNNSNELTLFYTPLTLNYPVSEPVLVIPKPELRYGETDKIIAIPLTQFLSDEDSLSINGNNYGYDGDTVVRINGILSENSGIKTAASSYVDNDRSIIVGQCAIDNLSGTVYFSKDDEGKTYSIEYVYYKD